MFKFLLLLIAVMFISSCQTTQGIVLSETPLAIRPTRVAISAALGEPRVISQNGREISTHFHDRKFQFLDVTLKTQERLYTKVLILGARRPYDIVVEVHVERRDPDTKNFQDVGVDEKLSILQARQVQQALNQSRDKAVVIDEGAPF